MNEILKSSLFWAQTFLLLSSLMPGKSHSVKFLWLWYGYSVFFFVCFFPPMPPAKLRRGNESCYNFRTTWSSADRDVWEITDLLNLYFHSWVCKKLISSKHHVHYWFLAPFPHLVLHYKASCSLMKEAGASLNGVIFYFHNSFVSMQRKKERKKKLIAVTLFLCLTDEFLIQSPQCSAG